MSCFHGFSTELDTNVSPLSWYSSSTSKVHSERLLCMCLSPCALYRQSNKTKNESEETRSDSFNDGQCRSWTRTSHKRRYECPMIPRHFENREGIGKVYWLKRHIPPPAILEGRHGKHNKNCSLRDIHLKWSLLDKATKISFEYLFYIGVQFFPHESK